MEILKTDDKDLIDKIGLFLSQGKVLVFPTDTVYGLIADAGNKTAFQRIFQIKKRNMARPLPFFVASIDHAKQIAQISERQEEFLKKVWPGKVTVVLESKENEFNGKDGTIALRIPDYQLVRDVLEKTGLVLTGTSANISDQPASCEIDEVVKQFQGQEEQPDVIIDAGNLPENKPSMVIDLTRPAIKTLRN